MGDFKNFVNRARGRGLPRYSFVERPFVKRFALCYRTVVCLSALSVTLVYCGKTAGWIKMKLGMEIRLGPGHIVLDGDPVPPRPKGNSPPIFGLLWPNGWMDQYATWYGGRPRPRPHCVRRQPSCPEKVHPQFSAHVYCGKWTPISVTAEHLLLCPIQAVFIGELECGPMPNVMAALPNIGGAVCSTPQSFADTHYLSAVQ